MKKSIVLLLLSLVMTGFSVCHAQNATVVYHYDNCGNRVERLLEFIKIVDDKGREDSDDGKGWLTMAEDSIGGIPLSLYPNPTSGKFTLSFSAETPPAVQAELCTAGGVVIEARSVKSTAEEFDLAGKPAGIYLLRLTAGRNTQTWKIIKKD